MALKVFNRLGANTKLQALLVTGGALVAATAIVKYNTIIHPFTLADNRHYMFYVFRYSILRAWWVRYALVPVYVVCGWLCWVTLRGHRAPSPRDRATEWLCTPFVAAAQEEAKDGADARAFVASAAPESRQPRVSSPPRMEPPTTSTALVLLLATALSLMTAPLVEPRYFILPWVFWRLHVPVCSADAVQDGVNRKPIASLRAEAAKQAQGNDNDNDSQGDSARDEKKGEDHHANGNETAIQRPPEATPFNSYPRLTLTLELAWSLAVNLLTMAVFIARSFYWRAADRSGALLDGGRVQRFMW